MKGVTVSVEIDAAPDEVWRAIEPIERHVDWMHDAHAIRFHGDRTSGIGTTFDCDTRFGPIRLVDRMEITEWEPQRTMGVRHAGVVSGTGRFTLTPIDHGRRTRFTWSERLTFPWWLGGPVGAWLAVPVMRAVWRRNLRTLRRIVETGA